MENILKERIKNLYKLINITPLNNKYLVEYVKLSWRYDKSPTFSIEREELDLKSEMREHLISSLLQKEKEKENHTCINEELYTSESILQKCKIDWSNQFKIGDPVYYKGLHGIISFKHHMNNHNDIQEWSVVSGNTEYRYITGSLLRPRTVISNLFFC